MAEITLKGDTVFAKDVEETIVLDGTKPFVSRHTWIGSPKISKVPEPKSNSGIIEVDYDLDLVNKNGDPK